MPRLDLVNPNHAGAEPQLTAAERTLVLTKLEQLLAGWPATAPVITVHELTDALLGALTPAQRTAILAKQPPRGLGMLVRRLLRETGRQIDES